MIFKRIPILLLVILTFCLCIASVSAAETQIDNSTAGGINGAITNDPSDTIILDPGIYSGNDNTNIVINKSVTIRGNGPSNTVIIDGGNINRLFNITSTGSLTLINVTLKDGFSNPTIPGVAPGVAGAIFNRGMVTMDNCILTGNQAAIDGGAIHNTGIAIMNNCISADNYAQSGGVIFNSPSGNFFIYNSNFSDNIADAGGSIHNYGNITIENSTFKNNIAEDGGAIFSAGGDVKIIGSTFKNNTAEIGGAIYIDDHGLHSSLNISYSILIDNNNQTIYSIGNSTADYNWWGSNNPINVTNFNLSNYYTMILNTSVLNNTLEIRDLLDYNYYFVLNGTSNNANAGLYFPYFEVDIYKNGVLIDTIDGRNSQSLTTELDSKVSNFSTTLDYETQEFIILATEPIPPIPPIPPVPPEPNNNTNNTSKNPVASAAMKETGIPVFVLLLILLSSLGLVVVRKR
ncbi:adhesin-like protein [Methanobrevibacter arboriphilus JCM 13429 = DSM 1125]|uniref:Adhesin-like protein n=1 Tax=Methanobrevibacter arboriphilus JCM 13429 = DSM 1125 TaxID=1300164 RepID=A0A1V6N199_METAZ|nr:hypothetical protein [Methanobrevibacter arboriphilus]OQD58387.1 adhesin-like protein [Methanobrevibacter arboriphilus JCM 13429 = DSM 1125]